MQIASQYNFKSRDFDDVDEDGNGVYVEPIAMGVCLELSGCSLRYFSLSTQPLSGLELSEIKRKFGIDIIQSPRWNNREDSEEQL